MNLNVVVFPYISDTRNNDVIAKGSSKRDDAKKDERVNKIMSMIAANVDWSKVVWEVEESIAAQDPLHEEDHVHVANDKVVSEENEPNEHVVKRSVKRKVTDPGYESRKQQLFFQQTAEQSRGLDDETKTFIA
ncbi:unnamed protein product [Eruca vesicaria subsp. sativa]|uniref:Uncharacterized protein n=1 Tax=Eruca vesicaria subsp. sativa TaxID=29727 RepID=A0ABC8JQY5_ERUVS|nr:unnamed protein product [Eruca vesicaria subsp. sativa]